MDLFFEILDDDAMREPYKIRAGLKIGRTKGEILLNDPKVSGSHAYVDKDDQGEFVLIDNNSSNGIQVNNRRVPRVNLTPGVTIQIGRMYLRVIEDKQRAAIAAQMVDWKDGLQKLMSQNASRFEVAHNPDIRPLNPPVKLTCVEGMHLDAIWIIAYGPRVIGSESLDLPIYERGVPKDAFQITPDENNSPRFKTNYPEAVRYNDQPTEETELQSGDYILMGQCRFKVEMLND